MKQSRFKSIKNGLAFLRRFIQAPRKVGSAFPSSPWLAKGVTTSIPYPFEDIPPRYYLEVGPGTGKVTKKIIDHLRPEDRLDLIELDEEFCNILLQQFGHVKNVHVYHTSITDWKPDNYLYHVIISGLPLNAFSSSQVQEILKTFQRLIEDGGILSYFEYPAIAKIIPLFLPEEKKKDFMKVQSIKESFFLAHNGTSRMILRNLPPARICRCSIIKTDFDV
ncbi:MAG: methyltransferase domain-containing protein [Waddliaceae bacterium]